MAEGNSNDEISEIIVGTTGLPNINSLLNSTNWPMEPNPPFHMPDSTRHPLTSHPSYPILTAKFSKLQDVILQELNRFKAEGVVNVELNAPDLLKTSAVYLAAKHEFHEMLFGMTNHARLMNSLIELKKEALRKGISDEILQRKWEEIAARRAQNSDHDDSDENDSVEENVGDENAPVGDDDVEDEDGANV